MKKKVVLAYSGGLDTSVILKWLLERGYEVVAFIADVGQREDFSAAEQKAKAIGATEVHVHDLRREFVEDYVFPALKGSAVYENRYLLGTSLARPIIAKAQIELARSVGANVVAHGATGKGNDQVRFELAYYALMPSVEVLAPWKMDEFLSQFQGRSDMLDYADAHGIPVDATKKAPYSTDPNLLHISYEAGILEDPMQEPPANMFQMTCSPQEAPDAVTELKLSFESGKPTLVENVTSGERVEGSLEIVQYLNAVAGKNGVGRIDIVENRYVGIKSRGVYESPAATVLWAAHLDLETISLDREVFRLKHSLSSRFAELIYNGYWFSPEMEFLQHAFEKSQENVSGQVRLNLYKGNVTITGRTSKSGLYNPELASMDVHGGYDQRDAGGFIRVQAVRLRARG